MSLDFYDFLDYSIQEKTERENWRWDNNRFFPYTDEYASEEFNVPFFDSIHAALYELENGRATSSLALSLSESVSKYSDYVLEYVNGNFPNGSPDWTHAATIVINAGYFLEDDGYHYRYHDSFYNLPFPVAQAVKTIIDARS